MPHTGAHCPVNSVIRYWALPQGSGLGGLGSVFSDVAIFHSHKWVRYGLQVGVGIDVEGVLRSEVGG